MTYLRTLTIIILIAAVVAFGKSGSAQANPGVYPNPPILQSPLDYSEGASTVTFSFASYNYYDGWYNGYPHAYYIEIYHGSTLIVGDYVFASNVSLGGFTPGETYSWRVYAVYDFYDAVTGRYEDWDETYWSSYATFVNIPNDKPLPPVLSYPNGNSVFAGGKSCNLEWQDSTTIVPNAGYAVDVARDSNFNSIIGSEYPDNPSVVFTRLPADGSRIYWRVIACNDFGCSDPSSTASFINDCYKASTGSGGGVSFDTCSDDYTTQGMTDYLLKDISHRGAEGMQPAASISTGLNSDNLRIEAGELKNTPIVPMQNPGVSWTGQSDAVHAQAYSGNFYDYLSIVFKKPATGTPLYSFDGNGSSMYNQMNGGLDCDANTAAYWDPNTWNVHFCGAGNSQYPELIGHEWGHAVTGTASSFRGPVMLTYEKESGALNEAFSDWMGLAFKNAYFGSSWNFGSLSFGALTPNYYKGNGYILPSFSCNKVNDYCGVHTNANVANTMFYFLAAGGVHPFSKIKVGKQVNGALQGIGIEVAMQIAFRANMQYWASNEDFSSAAAKMFRTVSERFSGNDYPNNLYQLKNAWAAVGVGSLPNITLTSSVPGSGTVSSTVKTIALEGFQKQYEPVWGQDVTVFANPPPGYEFESWEDAGGVIPDADLNYTFPAISDRALKANFKAIVPRDFGSINLGQCSLPQAFSIKNSYKPIITFGQAQISGANASEFVIISDSCSNTDKMYGSSCSIQITLTPGSAGLKDANLNISALDASTNLPVFTTTYPLTGKGVITGVSVSSSSTVGGTATISGSQHYGGTATAVATPNPGYAFNGWLENGTIVSSAASYSFIVTGSRSLMAKFTTTPAAIAAVPLSGIFGTIPTGQSSPVHSFTITNSGQQALTVTTVSLAGINPSEFGVTGNSCNQPLQPGITCSVQVSFVPASAGLKSARLNINSTDPATPAFVIDLSGYCGTPIMLYKGGYSPDYFNTVQTAYNNALSGNEIKLWASDFSENLSINRSVNVSIRGGYNGNFTNAVGKSALQGTLTITSGTLTVDGLQLGGSSYRSAFSVVIDTPGAGTVTSAPTGINCPGSCSASFINGDQVTLTATPVGGALFTGWSGGDCSGTGNCIVSMTDNITVTASFIVAKISVTPTSESLGTVFAGTTSAPQTITVTSTGTHNLTIGTLSLSGTNASEFNKTADNCSGHTLAPAATCTVQVAFAPASSGAKTANLLIPSNDPQTPVFAVSLNGIGSVPLVSVTKTGTGAGTITSSPAGISCDKTCSAYFTTNTTVSLTATPDIRSTFTGWTGACSGVGFCTINLTANTSVNANFDITPLSECSANPVNIGSSYYPNIQSAYNSATESSVIKLLAIDFTESFTANRNVAVTLEGGYQCGFVTNLGNTVMHSMPHLSSGTVKMRNIRISP